MSVHKVKSLFQNVRVRGFDSLKIGSVLKYITDLKAENNDEIGRYGQTLNRPGFNVLPKVIFDNDKQK